MQHDNINNYGFVPASNYKEISNVLFAYCIDTAVAPQDFQSNGMFVHDIRRDGIAWVSGTNLVGGYNVFVLGY